MPGHVSSPAPDDDRQAAGEPHGTDRSPTHIALLAATALGFAYGRADIDEAHAYRLAMLAAPDRGSLALAQDAVLTLKIGSGQARRQAARLLGEAARYVPSGRGSGLPSVTVVAADPGAFAATTEGRR